jgi:hypothetical protein
LINFYEKANIYDKEKLKSSMPPKLLYHILCPDNKDYTYLIKFIKTLSGEDQKNGINCLNDGYKESSIYRRLVEQGIPGEDYENAFIEFLNKYVYPQE